MARSLRRLTQHKIPMIQKVQKTVEILQVQLNDKVVEISDDLQSKDKCQNPEGARQNCARSSRAEEAVPAKCSSP